jgi:hypothetical protein
MKSFNNKAKVGRVEEYHDGESMMDCELKNRQSDIEQQDGGAR